MSKISLEAQKNYIETGGLHCPRCGSGDISSTDTLDSDGDCTWQPVACSNCGLTWTDFYVIYRIEIDHTDNYGMTVEVEVEKDA